MPDVRQAFRSLLKTPGFTVVALLTLCLGIGANTAMFSLVNALLFKSAPYPDPGQLVRIRRTSSQSQTSPHAWPDLRDFQANNRSLVSLTPFQWWTYSLSEPGSPAQRLPGVLASPDLFATLGIQPMLGRGFLPEEQLPGRDRVVVLSYEFWQRHFGGAADVIGRTLLSSLFRLPILVPSSGSYFNTVFNSRCSVWSLAASALSYLAVPLNVHTVCASFAFSQVFPVSRSSRAIPFPGHRCSTFTTIRSAGFFLKRHKSLQAIA